MEDIDEDLSTKCSDLKSYIQNLETGFTKQLEDLSRTLEENEQKYSEDYKTTQEKIVAINEKVVETRQIIGGTSGGSKVVCAKIILSIQSFLILRLQKLSLKRLQLKRLNKS